MMPGSTQAHSSRRLAGRRLLLALLDVRPRLWLSAWIWLSVLVVVYTATDPAVSWLDGWSGSTGGPGFLVYQRGERLVPAPDAGGYQSVERWWVTATLRQQTKRRGARVEATYDINQMPANVAETRPEYLTELKELLIERVRHESRYYRSSRHDDVPDLWDQTVAVWVQQIRTDSTVPVEIPGPLRYRLAWHGLQAVRILAWLFAAISIGYTTMRWTQISAYRRMLRRHESGHCPHCNYDIAAHPDAVCPECGCDHRARRREAIEALRRAKQWPLKGVVPSSP